LDFASDQLNVNGTTKLPMNELLRHDWRGYVIVHTLSSLLSSLSFFFIYLGLLYYLCFLANKDAHYCVTSNNMKLVHCNGCFLFLHRLLEKVTNLNEISDKIANKVLILTV